MSYQPRDLSVIGYSNGFTLWHLHSADGPEDIAAPGYFDDALNLLEPGDFILANLRSASDCEAHAVFVLTKSAVGVQAAVIAAFAPADTRPLSGARKPAAAE